MGEIMRPQPQPAPVRTPDQPIEALMQRWSISQDGIRHRARALASELIQPDAHTCLWPGEAIELGERFHSHLQATRPSHTFSKLLDDPPTGPVQQPELDMLSLAEQPTSLRPADGLTMTEVLVPVLVAVSTLITTLAVVMPLTLVFPVSQVESIPSNSSPAVLGTGIH